MTKSAESSTSSGSSETQKRRRQITSYKNTTTSPTTDSRRPSGDGPLPDGQPVIGHQGMLADLMDTADTMAIRAGAFGRVRRKDSAYSSG
jgi:hypothetical protein